MTDRRQTKRIARPRAGNGVSIATAFPRGVNSDANRTTPLTAVSIYCEGRDHRRKGKCSHVLASERSKPAWMLCGNVESVSRRDQCSHRDLHRDGVSRSSWYGGPDRASTRDGIDVRRDAIFVRGHIEQVGGAGQQSKRRLMAWFDGRGLARWDAPFLCQGELKRAPLLCGCYSPRRASTGSTLATRRDGR